MSEAEKILERNMHINGCFNVVIVQPEIYKAVIDAINEALSRPVKPTE